MTTGGRAQKRIAAYPVNSILSWMQGKTVTQGWDVVCAIAYDKINEWFLEQYVDRLSNGENAVINATVPQAGGISVQAVGLTLGPPLIHFSPTLPPDTVGLTVNFLSGQVNVIQVNGAATTVLSAQTITPGDDYALTGYVPLASVQGEVGDGHDVVIDVGNGASFAAKLGMPEGAETLLGPVHEKLAGGQPERVQIQARHADLLRQRDQPQTGRHLPVRHPDRRNRQDRYRAPAAVHPDNLQSRRRLADVARPG